MEWISLEEQLPTPDEDYLGYFIDGEQAVFTYYGDGSIWDVDGTRLTHWMPLPPPPQEGE